MKKYLLLLLIIPTVVWSQGLPFPGPGGIAGPITAKFDPATVTAGGLLTNGNLTYQVGASASVVRSDKFSLTKACFQITIDASVSGDGNTLIGVIDNSQATVTPNSVATVTIKMWGMRNDALAINNGSSAAYGVNFGVGAIKTICYDNTLGSGNGKIWVGVCSAGTLTFPSSGNPTTGANAMFSNLTGSIGPFINYQAIAGTPKVTMNSGQTAYSCTLPSGYGNIS